MNQIVGLINKLSPDGVSYVTLESLFKIRKGENLTNSQAVPGLYPVVTASRGSAFTHNDFNFSGECITISSHGAYAGYVSYYNQDFWLGNNVFLFERNREGVSTRFYFHVLKSFAQTILATVNTGGIPYINAKDLLKIRVPNPPFEIQNEIVRILDKFTELEVELEAELKARNSQYRYYRSVLLSFRNAEAEEVRWIPIGNVLRKLNSYQAIEKSEYQESGLFPVINQAQERVAGFSDREDLALQSGEYIVFGDHTRNIKYLNERFIAGESGTLIFLAAEGCRTKYLYYAFKNLDIQSRGYNRHWSVVKDMKIPIPSLEWQDRVVGLLDKFSELTGEISGGLPDEISLHRKQFAHYRNKLLSFPVMEVA